MKFVLQHLELSSFLLLILIVGLWSYLQSLNREIAAKKILAKAIASGANEPVSLHPEIDPALCAGCGSCTKACPEGDILQLVKHKAVLVSPSKCVGHGLCEASCPFGAITLVFGTKSKGMEIPRLTSNYESNVPGLYIAGELGGMGLIRNAIKQGALAANHALKNLSTRSNATYDLLIVGAGPAGLSAGLSAIVAKKKYLIIDQNSLGGTVANFPRQKIVMSQPAELPLIGRMKFPSNKVSKEQLLNYWSDIRKKTGLKVNENCRFEKLDKKEQHFEVATSQGLITAKKVILAMGVRGSPRRLGLANEDLPKVTYNLIDPEQYHSQDIVVVGGGNSAVEAAQMLAKKELSNKVILAVRGPQFDRCNEENQRKILELEKQGLVQIQFNTSVQEIQTDYIILKNESSPQQVKNDFVFVFAGAEMPSKFLMSLGIQFDKKFGEGLRKMA